MEFEHMSITTEKKNEGLVKLLIQMAKACDGETINHVIKESGQAEYAFRSLLSEESFKDVVIVDTEDVALLVRKLKFLKEEIVCIEQWADNNCIDIEAIGKGQEMSFANHMGNLSELADFDNDNIWNWTLQSEMKEEAI